MGWGIGWVIVKVFQGILWLCTKYVHRMIGPEDPRKPGQVHSSTNRYRAE
jgi:hypothetical protein